MANPNTTKQRKQRTKFYAATNCANLMPVACLAGVRGLAKSAGCSARNALSRMLLRHKGLYTVTQQGTEILVTPDYTKIQLSRGFVALPTFNAPSSEMAGEITGAVMCPKGVNPANARAIVVAIPTDLGIDDGAVILGDAFTFETSGANIGRANFLLPVPASYNGAKFHVYTYVQDFGSEEAARAYYAAQVAGANSDLNMLESQANYSNTVYMGSVNVM